MSDPDLSDLDEHTRKRIEAVRVGLDVEREKASSTTLRLILTAALVQAEDAKKALVEVDPHDWQAVQRLQNEVRRARDIGAWMDRAMQAGLAAEESLSEE